VVCIIKKIKIPEERKAVLIGKMGRIKKQIQGLTNTCIEINDEITASGEPIDLMILENIVKAIGRGFSPKNAFELLDEEYVLRIIDLPKGEKQIKRTKSRIIGTSGRCRDRIEKMTRSHICIYGKTVSIIGKSDDVNLAEDAIEKLISGATHKNVYAFLKRRINK
jgi:ribosomal RNA assembly protein